MTRPVSPTSATSVGSPKASGTSGTSGTSTAPTAPLAWRERVRSRLDLLTPRQRQYTLLGAMLGGGIGLLWLVFSLSSPTTGSRSADLATDQKTSVTNIGVLPPGAQVTPVDQWVGTAGRKLAQYESEREEQGRLNRDRQSFEARTMQRFAELEQRLTSTQQGAATSIAPARPSRPPFQNADATSPPQALAPATSSEMPPAGVPPAAPSPSPSPDATPAGRANTQSRSGSGRWPEPQSGMPPGTPAGVPSAMAPDHPGGALPNPVSLTPGFESTPVIVRISLGTETTIASNAGDPANPGGDPAGKAIATPVEVRTVATFLPVSFTRGTLLGGLDAPTGGQSQSNPHPVLIRLSDNSVLPNRFRGEYRDCFVIAAGYGDISAERAYLRTENLSCVRDDGATLEVRIQGSVYGEDGKVGMRGRLVTKQGQMLANALLAGVVSGIGQGLSTANTSYSTSPLGTTASTDTSAEAYRAGLGSGVGKALDRLAQYYIKLAENTFPVIEVDAGREIDVVITKGVRIDVPISTAATTRTEPVSGAGGVNGPSAGLDGGRGARALVRPRAGAPRFASPETRYLEASKDELY